MAQQATTPKIEELRFRVKTDPKSRLFYPLAEELRKIGQLGEAEQVLRGGLEHHTTYLSAWVSLGRVLRDQKNEPAAVEALTKAMQIDPGNVVAARLLADAYMAMGEKLEALKKYKLVYALMPGDQDLEELIARVEEEINPTQILAHGEALPFAAEAGEAQITPDESGADASPFAAEEARHDQTAPFASPPLPDNVAPFAREAEPEPAPAGSPWADGVASPEESAAPLADAGAAFTADEEPMQAAHDESPFEEPSSYSAASMEIEAPAGMHVGRAPLDAEVAAPLSGDLPPVDAVPSFAPAEPQPGDVADVFAPANEAPFADSTAAGVAEDLTNTLTMAELYARQGLVRDAQQIYENILQRDPGNDDVRRRLAALTEPSTPAPGNPKAAKLQSWLAKVGRREVGLV